MAKLRLMAALIGQRSMKKGTENGINLFSEEELDNLITRLTKHVNYEVKKKFWYTGHEGLPKGKTVEDIVQDAIFKVISGKRSWNRQKVSDIFQLLKGVVESDLSNLVTSSEHRSLIPHNGEIKKFDKNSAFPDPEKELQAKEFKDKLIDLVVEKGEEELLSVLGCVEKDITKPREIASQTGLKITDVNNAQKKLRRLAKSIYKSGGDDE